MVYCLKKTLKSLLNIKQQEYLKNKYWQVKYKFFKPKPTEIILDISASCNAACPFCPRVFMDADRSKGYMSLELYQFSLKEAKKHGIGRLRLYSTAEPTLNPNFSEMIDIAKEMGFFISVSTNASMMHKHMQALLKVDQIQFSIEGWDKESYEFYRQPLKFDKVYENIKHFNQLCSTITQKPLRQINLLLTKETQIDNFIALWGEFCDELHIHFMFPSSVFENGHIVSKIPLNMKDKLYDFTMKLGWKSCSYPFSVITVAYDGKISLCCDDFSSSFALGLITDGIEALYHREELEKIRLQFFTQKLNTCQSCNLFLKPQARDILRIKKELGSMVSQKAKIIFDY